MTGFERMALSTRPGNWVTNVQRFVRPREVAGEQCELCSAPIAAIWSSPPSAACSVYAAHVPPCSAIETTTGYREVPETVRRLANFRMTDAEWNAFGIPIGLAFFVQSTPDKRIVAFYPGPAGPMESLLDLRAWASLVADNPLLAELEPDSEALLSIACAMRASISERRSIAATRWLD